MAALYSAPVSSFPQSPAYETHIARTSSKTHAAAASGVTTVFRNYIVPSECCASSGRVLHWADVFDSQQLCGLCVVASGDLSVVQWLRNNGAYLSSACSRKSGHRYPSRSKCPTTRISYKRKTVVQSTSSSIIDEMFWGRFLWSICS